VNAPTDNAPSAPSTDDADVHQKRTSTIPAHWTVPAEVSASAVERPERVQSGGRDGDSKTLLVVLVIVLGLGTALLFGVFPNGDKESGEGQVANTATTVVKEPKPAVKPTIQSVAQAERPITEPAGTDPVPLAAEAIVPAVDNDPLVDVTAPPASGETGTATKEPAEDPAATVELDELPVRKKVKRYIEKGERYVRKGRYKSAARVLEKAARLDPNFPRVQRSLGIARARLGDYAGARKAYERYLELDPSAPDAADVRRILGQ